MKLYTKFRNSAGQRVRITLNLKNIPFSYVATPDVKKDDYAIINAQRLLPTIEYEGHTVGQSMAIIEWLEETHPEPSIFPEDPIERMKARAFAQYIGCEIHPIHNHRVRDYLAEHENWTDEKTMDWYKYWMLRGLSVLEQIINERSEKSRFCFGEKPTIADIFLVPAIGNARWFNFPLDAYPALLRVDDACRSLDAFRLSTPEFQPDYIEPSRMGGH